MKELKICEFDEHRHRYACWTAARAVQTVAFENEVICAAVNQTSLRESAMPGRFHRIHLTSGMEMGTTRSLPIPPQLAFRAAMGGPLK